MKGRRSCSGKNKAETGFGPSVKDDNLGAEDGKSNFKMGLMKGAKNGNHV